MDDAESDVGSIGGWVLVDIILKGILAAPPKATPPRNKGLIRPY